MSYQSTAPFYLTYTGLCLVSASTPADLFTWTMPNSGQRYVVSQLVWENLGTGELGAGAIVLRGFTATGGFGGPVFNPSPPGSLPSGAAAVTVNAPTGQYSGPNLVLRQTVGTTFSTAFGISVLINPMS